MGIYNSVNYTEGIWEGSTTDTHSSLILPGQICSKPGLKYSSSK